MKKIVIEKELCDPKNGEVVGPYYHIVQIDDENGQRTLLHTVDGDIKEAARYAERNIDFEQLEVAYQQDPNIFSSVSAYAVPQPLTKPLVNIKKRGFLHKLPKPVKKVLYWIFFPFVLVYMSIGVFFYMVGDRMSDFGDWMTGYRAHQLF